MINSDFEKNDLNKSGAHRLKYAPFVAALFAIYFDWAFFIEANFYQSSV